MQFIYGFATCILLIIFTAVLFEGEHKCRNCKYYDFFGNCKKLKRSVKEGYSCVAFEDEKQ